MHRLIPNTQGLPAITLEDRVGHLLCRVPDFFYVTAVMAALTRSSSSAEFSSAFEPQPRRGVIRWLPVARQFSVGPDGQRLIA